MGTNAVVGLGAYSKECMWRPGNIGIVEKEFKRKLEQGPVGHEVEFKCRVYGNGRVVADAETLRQLAKYSERQIRAGTGLRRDTIRLIRHGTGVKRSTYQRVIEFLRSSEARAGTGTRVHGARK